MFLAGKLNQIKSCFFKLRLHKEDPKEIIYDSEYSDADLGFLQHPRWSAL